MAHLRLRRAAGNGEMLARVDPLGGALACLTVDGADLVEPYAEHERPTSCAQGVLFPWPNRVAGARWAHEGATRLVVSEPQRGHALHGLVQGREFALAQRTGEESATLRVEVDREPGYPFEVALNVTYRLVDRGITVTSAISNPGGTAAPVALGFHPYLRVPKAVCEDLAVEIPAATEVTLDDRLIPDGRRAFDDPLRHGALLGTRPLNLCLTDRTGDPAAVLTSPAGGRTVVWADPDFTCTQVYVEEDFRGRRAFAAEPMTAPPDALNSGENLRWLEPGETWVLRWGIVTA